MPRKCCVPGCKSNYASTLREEKSRCVTTFAFPKNEKQRTEWIRAIPRDKWIPSSSAVVCCKHFNDSDIIRYDKYKKPDGSIQKLELRYPRLSHCAVPSLFPNLPLYFRKKQVSLRKNPKERRQMIMSVQVKQINDFFEKDLINNFEDLKNNYQKHVKLFNWDVKVFENQMYFYILNFEESTIERRINVDSSLTLKVFVNKNQLDFSDLNWIIGSDFRLCKWSQLINLLSYYKNICPTSCNEVS